MNAGPYRTAAPTPAVAAAGEHQLVVRIEPPEVQPVVVRVSTTAVRASQTPAARLALAFLGVALFCAANILFFARLAR